MLAVTFLALWLTMLTGPETPVAKLLRRIMVETPVAWLSRLTRGHIVIAIGVFAVTSVLLWLIGSEAVRVMGLAAPDALVWLSAFEVTSYVDALAAVAVAASSVRLRALGRLRRRQTARAPRAPQPVRREADNDNDDPERHPLAA